MNSLAVHVLVLIVISHIQTIYDNISLYFGQLFLLEGIYNRTRGHRPAANAGLRSPGDETHVPGLFSGFLNFKIRHLMPIVR